MFYWLLFFSSCLLAVAVRWLSADDPADFGHFPSALSTYRRGLRSGVAETRSETKPLLVSSTSSVECFSCDMYFGILIARIIPMGTHPAELYISFCYWFQTIYHRYGQMQILFDNLSQFALLILKQNGGKKCSNGL